MVTVVVLAALLAALLPWLAPLVSDDPEVVVATERFLGVALFGLPFTAAAFGYSALLSSLGKTRVLVPATILLAATNALLGWVLIFGRFGAPPMGIRGAAIASVAAEIVTFLFLTVYLVRLPATRRLGLFRFRGWNRRVVRRLFRLSGPVSLQGFVQAIRWFLFFVLVATLGPVALAVASVVYACYVTLRIPTEAFAEAACSLTSRLIGRDRPGRVGIVVRSATTGASIITAPAVVLALIAPEWVLSVFSLEPSLLRGGSEPARGGPCHAHRDVVRGGAGDRRQPGLARARGPADGPDSLGGRDRSVRDVRRGRARLGSARPGMARGARRLVGVDAVGEVAPAGGLGRPPDRMTLVRRRSA